jgi:hypothetical protein
MKGKNSEKLDAERAHHHVRHWTTLRPDPGYAHLTQSPLLDPFQRLVRKAHDSTGHHYGGEDGLVLRDATGAAGAGGGAGAGGVGIELGAAGAGAHDRPADTGNPMRRVTAVIRPGAG